MADDRSERLKDAEKKAKPRLEDAINDRAHIEPFINDVFAYGLPGRRMMGQATMEPWDSDDQHRIFDPELQFNVREAAAELKQIYTPYNRNWAKLKPKIALDPDMAKNEDFLAAVSLATEHVFEAMRSTRLDTCLDGAWEDWMAAAGTLQVTPGKGWRTTLVEHVPLPEVYLEACGELPGGIDGRWRMRHIKRRNLKLAFPMVDWEQELKERRKLSSANNGEESHEVTFGYRFDPDSFDKKEEAWFVDVFLEKTLVHTQRLTGWGKVGLIPFRAGENAPSAWGRGPASIALSPARALDQIAYLTLKVLPKRVDPPMWHTQDGVFNPENEIIAGDFVPVGPEFQMGPIESKLGMDDLYTEVEMLRFMVKRALWQDRPDPYESGTTPPTAYQIQTQELGRAIRQERPRSRVNPELVMPLMERFIRIESDAGRMKPIKVSGQDGPVILTPQSPMQRSKDLEDVQHATMLLELINATMPQRGALAIDARTTIADLRDKLEAHAVHLMSVEEAAEEEALAAGAQSAGAVAGETVGASAGMDLAAA